MGKNSGNHSVRWPQVLRPVFWWLLLLMGLFGIRTHERLMEQTRLNFTITLNGQPLEAVAVLDRHTFSSGQNISLGNHRFVVSNPKTEPFATNFLAWYGPHNFGDIKLKRGTGTLNVQANPPASTITITGPEFSTILSNSIGTNISVPTDSYTVSAQYSHWSQSQNVTIYDNQSVPCNFAPQLGALHLTSNKDGAMYLLQSADQTFTGNLPVVLTDLPVENYQLTVTYHRRHIKKPVIVEAGVTNEMPVQFILGAVRIESSPTGASVATTNGSYLGQTPLDLLDVPPQTAQLNLSLSGYEPVPITVEVFADQTNSYRTNLVSIRYLSAMQDARTALVAGNYAQASRITTEVLNTMPDDADAQALQTEAKQHLDAEHQQADAENDAEREREEQLKRPRQVFDAMCRQNLDSSLFTAHELKTDKSAKEVAAAIAKSLSSEPGPFELLHNDSPKPDVYEVMARQRFSLGILGGTERVCLLVIGQAKPDETLIFYKVLEYQIKTTVDAGSLFNGQDKKQMIPVSPEKIQMTDELQNQIREGTRLVSGRIRTGVEGVN
jgi:PEGA domain